MGNPFFLILLYSSLIIVAVFFILKKNWIFENKDKVENFTKYLMLFVIVVRYITYTHMGMYTWYLSLHICNISAFLFVIYFFTKKPYLKGALFLLSFFATAALVQPHMSFTYKNPLYYTFIIDHIVLFFVPFYFIVHYSFVPKIKEILMTLSVLIPLIYLGSYLNTLFDENYFYLNQKPLSELFMKNMPTNTYILIYIFVIMLGFSLISYIGSIYNKRISRKKMIVK